MKDKIKKILSEDFDWIQEIPSTPNGVKIGPPLSQSNPKNEYRIVITHGYGEDYSTWADDWRQVDAQDPQRLLWYIKILMLVGEERETWNAQTKLAEQMVEGRNRWVLEDAPWNAIPNDWSDYDELIDILSDLFYDIGAKQYDSYYQDDASLENFKVIYFDGYGVPHKVEIDRRTISQDIAESD